MVNPRKPRTDSRPAFLGAQRTHVLAGDDPVREAVDLVTLRRRPAARPLQALQKAEPEHLRIVADPDEARRIPARRHHIASAQFERLARAVPELGGAANDPVDDHLAFRKAAGVRCGRSALRQQRLAARIGGDDVAGDQMPARHLDADIAHIDRHSRCDDAFGQRPEQRIQRQRILQPEAGIGRSIMQRMGPGHPRGFGLVDLVRADDGRVREGRGIGNESFEKLAGIAHGHGVRHHRLRRLQVLLSRQTRPGVEQLAMHDRALQHHRARPDIIDAAIVVEGEHARGHQHQLKAARRQVKVEIGGAGILAVDRQVSRDLVQQEGLVVGVEAFIGATVQRLRAIGRLVGRILVAIDGHEILMVEAERIAVGARQARPFEIDRSMHVHGILQSGGALGPVLLRCTMRISRQRVVAEFC